MSEGNLRRSQRINAGTRSRRDENFTCPLQMKQTNQEPLPEPKYDVDNPDLPDNTFQGPVTVERATGNFEEVGRRSNPQFLEETRRTSRNSNPYQSSKIKSSSSKMSSLRRNEIEKRRLALETEKAKAELMMMRRELDNEMRRRETERVKEELMAKKQELDNQLNILRLEKELAEVELEGSNYSIDSESSNEINSLDIDTEKHDQVQNWIETCEYSPDISKSNTNQQTDIDKLCNVIANAIKSVSNSQVNEIPRDLVSRQILDRDFPFFDGKPEDWPMFKNQFERKVAICKYSDDETMMKLQRCLKGEALEAVRCLLLHPGNVSSVIQTLEMRFGRPQYVIKSLIDKIQNFPSVREGDFTNLIKFSCNVNNLIATLEQFEASNHVENPYLLEHLIAKIPSGLRLLWGQVLVEKKGKANVKDFGKWVNEISSAACYVSTPTFSNFDHGRKYNSSDFKKSYGNQRSGNVVLHAKENSEREKCLYCDKVDHSISKCPNMLKDNLDDRWAKILTLKVCFKCLKKGHSKMFCKSKKICGIDNCRRPHHHLLHKSLVKSEINPELTTETSLETVTERVCLSDDNSSNILLRIIPVKLFGPEKVLNTYALFDEGSTISLIENDIAQELKLFGKVEPFCMQWANDILYHNDNSRSVQLQISGVNENARIFEMSNVRTVNNLSLPSQTVLLKSLKDYSHLRDLPISDIVEAKPTILIGQDYINLTVARKVYQSPLNRGPIATKTNLGWVVHGNIESRPTNRKNFNFHICNFEDYDELNILVKESFSTDSFGTSLINTSINPTEKRAMKILEDTTKFLEIEHRYETGLLWKSDNLVLPESRSNAYNRLLCIERKMLKDRIYFEKYCTKIDDYLKKGYIRKLSREESLEESDRSWYLPHFGVVNPNKPNKFRLVFDAASRSHGVSLNDNLLQGPDFLNSLPGVLMRFRRFKYGFCGDISEMFHQIKIRKEDRISQRFLWRNGIQQNPVETFEMQVMTFGAACSPCSAQFVIKHNARNSKISSDLARDVERCFYMDDYLDSCENEESACDKVREIIDLHKQSGFNIVNWVSNSQLVNENYSGDMPHKDLNKSDADRVLGIWWDTKSDEFTFKLAFHKVPENVVTKLEKPTKRQVLKIVMSIFDPLGFLTWFTIRGRIILQKIWRCGIMWDDKIPDTVHQDWTEWLKTVKEIPNLRLPRCYSVSLPHATQLEIHTFGDASEEAFSSIAYLRIVSENKIEVAFITARARVSPLKPISVPRLELQAAVMSTRLLKTVVSETDIPINKSYLWSDSKTVLHWIRGDGKNYKQFVAHRVGEIQEGTSFEQWRYVPSELNIADFATRSKNDNHLIDSWFRGPEFLHQPESEWPKNNVLQDFQLDDDKERKINSVFVGAMRLSEVVIPDVSRFSKWRKFIRATAWILRGNSSDACEIRDPCQHGGICISTDSGPICECRNPDYEGEHCEKDKAPSEAVFRGTEFLSYDLSQTGGEPIVSAQDSVTFYFKTRQPSGLLFYTGDGNDFLNVAIKDGCLSLTMGLSNGKQEMQIKPNKVRFDDNQWHKVSVHRRIQEISTITSFCRLSAVVDAVYADHSHIAGKFTMLSSSRVYVGGSINTRALPGARVHNNFVGCMRKVEFVADTLRLNLLELGRSGSHLIQVAGRLDYKCPTGETHDPITFTTRESHLILPPWNAKKSGNISFKFRTNEANGLILFNGGIRAPRVDLFAVEIYNGHIYVHLDLGSGPSKQRGSRRRIDDGAWHEVTFRRTGRDSRITVDGFHSDFKTLEGSTSLELDGNMYVGGLGAPFSEIPVPAGLWTAILQQGFVGCFKDLIMNNEAVDVAGFAREQDSGSIRTLCHTLPQQCPSQPCLNGGTCTEGWNRFICDCTNTLFSGPTCGKEAPTLSFNGTQHMSVTMDAEQVTQTEDAVLRFRTSKPLGLLLITSTVETGDRIELAVAAGRIRLALRLGVREKKKEDREKDKILLAGQNVNDNEFHTVRLSRRGSNLKLQLDGQSPIRAEIQGKYSSLQWRTIHLGGLYHLEEEISMSTTVPNFVGDIQQFYFNNIPYIELARALSTEQSIAGFPNIKVAAKFVKHATDNLHRPVTFRSKHTFIGLPMLRAYASIHIDFMFRTREANGLILFNGGKKEDFVAVELVDGHINYIVNVGDGTVTLRDAVRENLNDNRWHTVGIRRPSVKQHTLMVDNDIVIAANFGTGNLELDGILYLGGVYKDLYALLPQDDVKSKHGFEGCIAGLDLNGESPNIMEDAVVHSSLVTSGCEGQSAKCSHNVCANAGICVQQWNSYTCDCDMTSFTGPTCSDESVSYEFGPNRGIITYTYPEDARPEMQEDTIAIGLITTKSDAVLLRIVSGTSNDYIEMYIVEGNVFVVYNLGTNDLLLGEISVKVNDNAYHVIRYHRYGHNSTLQVDDYNVQTNHPSGHQLQVFNSQSQIQIGGKWNKKGRIERPFSGVISGVVVNGLRILDLAVEKDVHTSIRGDVQLISGIMDRQDHLQKMQQTPASGFPGLEDDLVFSGAGSGCNGDDEDECPPLPESGSGDDDLITPVYVPPTRPPPTKTPKKQKKPEGDDKKKQCDPDDEDCLDGSGSGEVTEEATTKTADITEPGPTSDNTSAKITEEPSSIPEVQTTSPIALNISTVGSKPPEQETTITQQPTIKQEPTVSLIPTEYISTTVATTTTERFTIHPIIPAPLPPEPPYNYRPPSTKRPERVSSETSEVVALIIGIIAGALIAIILIILVILKFKSRSDRAFKVDDSKGYQQGPNAALLGNTSSTNGQPQYQVNGALRNGDKSQMQKSKKRDSKDIKEWYV